MCSYRKVVLRVTWDGQDQPSILAPVGDFFCIGQSGPRQSVGVGLIELGHSMPGNFQSLPFTVSAKPTEDHKYGGSCAANCYLTMPFNKRAKIEVINEGEHPYFQVCTDIPRLDGSR